MKPRLLDLFCGAGGCAAGYQRVGFRVTGVDILAQPSYCGDFYINEGSLAFVERLLWRRLRHKEDLPFEAIHASPPCQKFSSLSVLGENDHLDLLTPTRALLEQTGLPWVIENVPGSPMRPDAVLCGSMFGLPFRRHRWFEFSWREPLLTPGCDHSQPIIGVYGASDGDHEPGFKHPGNRRGPRQGTTDEIREAMEMPWATSRHEITEAVPPAFTEYIGRQLLERIELPAERVPHGFDLSEAGRMRA